MGKKKEKVVQLTPGEIRQICEEAVDRGVAKYIHDEEKQKKRREKKLLYSTKTLLDNYLRLKTYANNAMANLDEIVEETLPEFYTQSLEVFGLTIEDRRSYSIAKSLANTVIILNHVERMLDVYKVECESSPKPTVQRRYQIIDKLYLSSPRMSIKEIADELFMDPRSVQRDAEKAREDLKILIFGADGLSEEMGDCFR